MIETQRETHIEELSYAGWIKKKGRSLGLWHKRFGLLEGTVLQIFKDDTRKSIETSIDILPETKVFIDQRCTSKFIIQTGDNSITLAANSNEEATRWVTALSAACLPTPKLSMNDFNIISKIGRGYYGKVMLVQKKDTLELFAIKSIHKSFLVQNGKTSSVIAERNLMMKAKYPFLVTLFFTFQTESKFYLGLEYVPGGDLSFYRHRVDKIPFEDIRLYIAEIGLAITYLHSIGIVYRDLKPENVLIDSDGHIKLVDFGLSKDICNVNTTSTFCGTPGYIAPETIQQKTYGYKVDEWALGVLLYDIVFGYLPFEGETMNAQYRSIVKNEPKIPDGTDPALSDIILQLLRKDPKSRPMFSELKNHPFFAGLEWDKVFNKEYEPVYKPMVKDNLSLDNFDPDIRAEQATDSYSMPAFGDVRNVQGFSFCGELENVDDECI